LIFSTIYSSEDLLNKFFLLWNKNEKGFWLIFIFIPQQNMIQIFIRLCSSINGQRTIAIDTCSAETIQVLKIKIHAKIGIPPDLQCLIYRGKCLVDNQDIEFYKISKESNLFLNLRFKNWKCKICNDKRNLEFSAGRNGSSPSFNPSSSRSSFYSSKTPILQI